MFKQGQTLEAKRLIEERGRIEKRTCKVCNKEQFLNKFPGRIIHHLTNWQVSFLNSCKKCYGKKNVVNIKNAKKKDHVYSRACGYWQRSNRLGIKSDLKLRDIRLLLSCKCYYCETDQSEMTLDRKDSNDGYTKNNVVPCCWRCNTIKSDMPWEAWKNIFPAIRNTAKLGLFDEWRKLAIWQTRYKSA